MQGLALEHIMTEEIVTIKENATVGQAAHILLRFRINGILIVAKDDKNKILGIITTTDLLRLLAASFAEPRQRMAALKRISARLALDVASKEVMRVQVDTKIEKLASIMHRRNIHTIPVFKGDQLVGIVGRHDVLNAMFAMH